MKEYKLRAIMKKAIVLAGMAFLLLAQLKSQVYVPFPTSSVNWNVLLVATCDNEKPPETTLLRYALHGDTLIDHITYSRLCIESGDTACPEVKPIGGLREADKRIYYKGQTVMVVGSSDEEYLLYDFNAKAGDTIRHDADGSCYSVVLAIDSVLTGEHYRKRYQVDISGFCHDPDYLIEGIGSVKNGLLGHISDVPTCGFHYWEHVCFRGNGVVLHLNPSFSDCFPAALVSGSDKALQGNNLEIFPNPVGNEVWISNPDPFKNLVFRLIDINGKTLAEKQIAGNRVMLNMDMTPGVYYGVILDERGNVLLSRKLLVH